MKKQRKVTLKKIIGTLIAGTFCAGLAVGADELSKVRDPIEVEAKITKKEYSEGTDMATYFFLDKQDYIHCGEIKGKKNLELFKPSDNVKLRLGNVSSNKKIRITTIDHKVEEHDIECRQILDYQR